MDDVPGYIWAYYLGTWHSRSISWVHGIQDSLLLLAKLIIIRGIQNMGFQLKLGLKSPDLLDWDFLRKVGF